MSQFNGERSSMQDDTMKHRMKKKPPKIEKKKMKGKYRFRAAVRMVIANMDWLVESDEEDEDIGDGDLAKLNRIMLRGKKNKDKKSILSLAEKSILLKDASERTDEEKRRICFVIGGLRCFRLYPEAVRAELAACTYFMYYHENREVVRQGHAATGLYFILEGKVDVLVSIKDPVTGEVEQKMVGNMEGGDMFGEVSLLHNIPRTATIITATDCNFLCLRKADFDTVLKSSLVKQWDECKVAMQAFPYFDGWSEVSVRECCILSKMKTFAPNETVFGAGAGLTSFVHFVLSGEVQVMEVLKLAVSRDRGVAKYRQFNEVTKLRPNESLETYFMQVCLLKGGSCFGLGENLYGRSMVANVATKCLLCPRYWVLQKSKANIWQRIITFMNDHVPSSEELFQDFLEQRKWLQYRRTLVNDIISRGPRKTKTSYHDVPYSLRMKEHIQHDRPGLLIKEGHPLLTPPPAYDLDAEEKAPSFMI